ncbi:tetraspanin-7-like isoform X2 [Daphnia carinata]|uniref:tetraspanin-7-like isoform X2 n=1 Tax=Daphnia carinata TaxID=120202 RepID=UPI00257AF033|nr:tetraspanin-7-like isoform X2 [Daphnia carinata]
MQMRKHTAITWCAFILIFATGVVGAVILAVSLRIVFDNDYSYLLFHGSGNYLAGHVLVAVGVSLMIVSSIGCTGVVKGNPPLLGLGVFCLVLLVAVQLTIARVAYDELAPFHEKVHLGIFWAIQRHYGNDVANTTVIDLIQQGWKCCGLNTYASWSNSLYSKRHVSKGTWPTRTFIVPKSYCIDRKSDLCEEMHLGGIRINDTPVGQVLFMEGCGPKVIEAIDYYLGWLFGVGAAIVSFEIIATILCVVLLYEFIKSAYLIKFKSIKSPESTDLMASEQPGIPPREIPMSHSSTTAYSSTRISTLVTEKAISSLV